MVVVTIALETAEDEARLLELLPTVHGRVIAKDKQQNLPVDDDLEERRQRLRNAMNKLAENKTGEKFGDASEWQRAVRGWDRVLEGREE